MSKGAILVTGGAGYIGSHVVARLGALGEEIIVLDNLSTGSEGALLYGSLVVGDVGDAALVLRLLQNHRIDTVLHFAARIVVPESVAHPLAYYDSNTARARVLLDACRIAGVKHFVFSSTAAVYGDPPGGVADEHTPPAPINPYGRSKLMTEWMLRDLAAVSDLRYVALRYFNVAGCDAAGRIGQDSPDATHLIKVACQHAVGLRNEVAVFGSDYDTPDGTCVRDYIHVEDLAEAHVDALAYLRNAGTSLTANCGYGHGFSVREVIDVLADLHGTSLSVRDAPRRPGDMAMIVADASVARQQLGWRPQRDELRLIVASALAWEYRRLHDPVVRPLVSPAIQPMISVVIPLYNGLDYLERALASVQEQDYPPGQLQIVIVDDGSTDGSAELAERMAASDSRILVLRQANAGPAAARNLAIKASAGELIAFLDCDDTWEPSKLSRQAALYRDQPELGLIHCTCSFVDASGDPVTGWMRRSRPSRGDVLLDFFCDFFLITSASMVPRHCLDAVGHFDPELRIGEDNELFLRLLARYRVGCIDAPLLNRTIRAESLSRQDFDLDAHNDLLIMDRFLHAHPRFARANPVRIAQRYASYLYDYGYGLLEHGRLARGRSMLLRSWRWKPSMPATRALVRSLLPRRLWRILRSA